MMSRRSKFEKPDVSLRSPRGNKQGASWAETPFRIAILGDFSGRSKRALSEPVAKRHFYLIDRDNFDEVMSKLKVEAHLPILGKNSPAVNFRFSELGDFHPDHLFENLEIFEALRETRQGLKDPATFAVIGKRVQDDRKPPDISATPKATKKSLEKISVEKPGGLLDQMLEEAQGKPSQPEAPQESSEWDNFLREIVKPRSESTRLNSSHT